ncbi:lysophospholipid acyltransferase family protein [Hydrogenophaga sp. 5NK40-0174]|uniref:lysophospholipid acyltransferase family protein n=1 Tax=Hydrogenophaga sp. 5NK40-0174 TaxID=3127649 RepID=UPI0031096B45
MTDVNASPLSVIQRVRAWVAMALGLGTLGVFCVLWWPVAAVLAAVMPEATGQRVGRRALHLGARLYVRWLQLACGCRFDLQALTGLAQEGPMVVAANHPSLLDAVLLLAYLPNAVCVMKTALQDNWLFGPAARLAGFVPNRDALEMVLRGREVLDGGAQLIIFPEGTRTVQSPMNTLQSGAAMIATKAKVPMQVLTLTYSSPYLGKHWPLFRPPQLPLVVRARRVARFAPAEHAQALTAAMEASFQQALAEQEETDVPLHATAPAG